MKETLHRETIQSLRDQAELLMKRSDPRDIIADALEGKGGDQVDDVIAYGGDMEIYEEKSVVVTEVNKSPHLVKMVGTCTRAESL